MVDEEKKSKQTQPEGVANSSSTIPNILPVVCTNCDLQKLHLLFFSKEGNKLVAYLVCQDCGCFQWLPLPATEDFVLKKPEEVKEAKYCG